MSRAASRVSFLMCPFCVRALMPSEATWARDAVCCSACGGWRAALGRVLVAQGQVVGAGLPAERSSDPIRDVSSGVMSSAEVGDQVEQQLPLIAPLAIACSASPSPSPRAGALPLKLAPVVANVKTDRSTQLVPPAGAVHTELAHMRPEVFMSRFRMFSAVSAVSAVVLCSALPAAARSDATVVNVIAGKSGYSFTLSKSSVPHGAITFKVERRRVPTLVQTLLYPERRQGQLLCRERHADDRAGRLSHPDGNGRAEGKLRIPLHRSWSRRERDEGHLESHLTRGCRRTARQEDRPAIIRLTA